MEFLGKKFFSVRFNRKSGKIIESMEGYSRAMIEGMAVYNNIPKTQDLLVFDEDGNVTLYMEGTGQFPHITKTGLGTIDKYCPGLLDAMKEST